MDIVKFNKDNMFMQIKASLMDDSIELSPVAAEKKKRIDHIFALRHNNKYSRHQAIQRIIKDYGVSQATAYRDYTWAMQLHGDLDQVEKNAERMILLEAYWNLYQMALKNKDTEQARKALDSYKSLLNFGAEESPIDPDKIQAHEYHIHLSREGSKVLKSALATGVVDFNSVGAEDVEYEEVADE